MVIAAKDVKGLAKTLPADAQVIHFCPPFFEMARMEDQLYILETDESKKSEICNLANLDSTARAVLHEITQ